MRKLTISASKGTLLGYGFAKIGKVQCDLAEGGWYHSGLVRSKLVEHCVLVLLNKLHDLGAQSCLTGANVGVSQRKYVLEFRTAHRSLTFASTNDGAILKISRIVRYPPANLIT